MKYFFIEHQGSYETSFILDDIENLDLRYIDNEDSELHCIVEGSDEDIQAIQKAVSNPKNEQTFIKVQDITEVEFAKEYNKIYN